MTATLQADTEIIRTLVKSFIDHPHNLLIETKEHPGIVYWTMQFHADDHSKAVGKRGAHYDALKLLITEIGRAHDVQYILRRYREPEPAERQENMRRGCPEEYDANPAVALLVKILELLDVGQFIVEIAQAQGEHPLSFTLSIIVREPKDYNTLTVPREENALPMTTVGAIGTLFRAYGNRNGVKFAIDVQRA